MTTQADLNAAWSAEIDNCGFRAGAGTRIRSRPQQFCDSVTLDSTLDVASTASFGVPIEVAKAVVVDGKSYEPAPIIGLGADTTILTENGKPIFLEAPSGTFTDLKVTGTLTITGSGVLNAGTY